MPERFQDTQPAALQGILVFETTPPNSNQFRFVYGDRRFGRLAAVPDLHQAPW
jgi:hypothetical protein